MIFCINYLQSSSFLKQHPEFFKFKIDFDLFGNLNEKVINFDLYIKPYLKYAEK